MSETLDFFVIGGGSGGVRAARVASQRGARVAIAEQSRYGGTCVIRGCVPKKLFVYASEYGHRIPDAAGYGWNIHGSFDWEKLVANKDAQIDRLNKIYIDLLTRAGVELHHGRAVLRSPNEVEVNGKTYKAKHILIATGGRPTKPEVPGSELAITSNEAFHLETLPKHITIVGGGYIGLEFTSIFQGLGAQVTLVHHRDKVLRGFDIDIRTEVTDNLRRAGVELLFDTEVAKIEPGDGGYRFECTQGDSHEADLVMFATGRLPMTEGIGLEEAGVELNERGGVVVDEFGQSSVDNIYAVGDCTDLIQLTPVAIREGQAVVDTLFGNEPKPIRHETIPTAIFTQPEAATVGLTEERAREKTEVDIYRTRFRPLFHSLSGRDEKVMMKLVVDRKSDRVLGAHMVGEHAAEIIQSVAIAVHMGATKADFDKTVALHPSTAEEFVLMRSPVAES